MNKMIEAYLHKHFPVSRAMGIHVEQASLSKAVLSAPLASNVNDKGIAFGGSLNTVCTLACWCLLYMNMEASAAGPVRILIASSNTSYQAPVDADFKAECLFPQKLIWDAFLTELNAKGKARIELTAKVGHKGGQAVEFHSIFAAIKESRPS